MQVVSRATADRPTRRAKRSRCPHNARYRQQLPHPSTRRSVGFTCEGSLIERYTCCKNPNCRCADPEQRHGPYWQLSWKENGKTISRLLSAEDTEIYRNGSPTAAALQPRSSRCETSPDKQASRSSPAAADPSTAPHVHASGATQPPERPRNPGTSRYPRVLCPQNHPTTRGKSPITRNFPLVLK